MRRKLTAVEARKELGEVLNGVFYRNDEVVIERAGKPMAAVIPVSLYERILRERERFWQLWERNRDLNADMSEEEVDALVAEAVQWARSGAKAQDDKEPRPAEA